MLLTLKKDENNILLKLSCYVIISKEIKSLIKQIDEYGAEVNKDAELDKEIGELKSELENKETLRDELELLTNVRELSSI